ncbi:MAG: hypothetical protein AB1630_05600 [bacterium]
MRKVIWILGIGFLNLIFAETTYSSNTPILTSPLDKSTLFNPPTFVWSSVNNSSGYELVIGRSSNPADNPELPPIGLIGKNSYSLPAKEWAKLPFGTHYWSVRSAFLPEEPYNFGPYAQPFSFNKNILPRILTIASLNPNSGVSITVSPNDNNGQGNGSTQFTRTYNNNTVVTLTAPTTAGGNNFQKWQRNGVDYSTNQTIQVTMDVNYTLTAVYTIAETPLLEVKTNKVRYSPNEKIIFKIYAKDPKGAPLSGQSIGIHDPINCICTITKPTDSNGYTEYVVEKSANGYYLFGFFPAFSSSEPLTYGIVIDDELPIESNEVKAVPFDAPSSKDIVKTGSNQPSNLDKLTDITLNTLVETATNPAVIFTGLLCVGAIISILPTVGGETPVAVVACGAFVETTKLTLAMNTGKNAAKLSVDLMPQLTPEQKEEDKNLIDSASVIYSMGITRIKMGKSPMAGKPVITYEISTTKSNFANQYFTNFLTTMGDCFDDANNVWKMQNVSTNVRKVNNNTVVAVVSGEVNEKKDPSVQEYVVLALGLVKTSNADTESVSKDEDSLIARKEGVVAIPAGALETNTAIRIRKLKQDEIPDVKGKKATQVYAKIELESGQTVLNKPVAISIPYKDDNQDDIVDETDIKEENIRLNLWNGTNWEELSTTIDKQNNITTGKTNHFSIFGLFEQEPRIPTPTCVKTRPNPFSLSKHQKITFWGSGVVPYDTKIKIFTLSQDLVKEIKEKKGKDELYWDGTNERGQKVVPGIYIYTTESPKEKDKGKIIIIK